MRSHNVHIRGNLLERLNPAEEPFNDTALLVHPWIELYWSFPFRVFPVSPVDRGVISILLVGAPILEVIGRRSLIQSRFEMIIKDILRNSALKFSKKVF